ncbi:MAG: acyl-CoA dehydrogenase family protein [Candidatus Omnitrophica bacterium]|nr:acyl-CoA dehydrogenase family protein [Candidatus Omnitrophota bacterium]
MSMYSKDISAEKLKSLEFAEDARESEWKYPSFVLKLFHGQLDWKMISPFPTQNPDDKKVGDAFIAQLKAVLTQHIDPNEVDRTGLIPDSAYKALGEIGAYAIKVPKEYGGLGLSQMNYSRAIHLVASYCASTAVMLSAHQSIGVPQPLKLFGTEEQKKKFLPLFGKGMISAFALTEPEAGSDPRNMKTTAFPTEDGKHFLINGDKLWCTNGPIAGILVVMAVTPPKVVNGKEIKQITAFIVETNTPGFEIVHRCDFMGLKGIQNGLLRFTNVKVPRENIIAGEGEGLRLALTTLNTGRLTLPAASVGAAKWCLNVVRQWSVERKQWGSSIGEHESIALKLGYIASHTFALDAIAWLTSAMADDKKKDIRLEAAIAKYFSTEEAFKIADETLQIRAGQGYETAPSLKKRGMHPWAVERMLRDLRINRIIEGTSEIMHLFIAREALDPHLSRVKALLSGKSSGAEKMKAFLGAAKYYPVWFIKLFLPATSSDLGDLPPALREHVLYARRTSKRLAREVFFAMLKYQQKLESKQGILSRLGDIGTDLFAISASCSYALSLSKDQPGAVDLADLFCRDARQRIESSFGTNKNNHDRKHIQVSRELMKDSYNWLESDIMV